jgi:photosystem II stability/assembly factor-like uncharacterized protein
MGAAGVVDFGALTFTWAAWIPAIVLLAGLSATLRWRPAPVAVVCLLCLMTGEVWLSARPFLVGWANLGTVAFGASALSATSLIGARPRRVVRTAVFAAAVVAILSVVGVAVLSAFWRPLTVGNLESLTVLRSGRELAVGSSGTVIGSTDAGRSWRGSVLPSNMNLTSVALGSPRIALAVGSSPDEAGGLTGNVLRTTDFGASWVRLQNVPHANQLGVVDWGPHRPAVAVGGFILLSNNSGESWQSVLAVPSRRFLNDADFSSVTEGWAVGNGGAVLRTSDGGNTWIYQQTGMAITLNAVSFADKHSGWAVGWHGTVIATSDGGRQWVREITGTTRYLNGVVFRDDLHGVIVGENGLVLTTSDGGTHWLRRSSGVTVDLNCVRYSNGVYWVVGNIGTVLESTDGGASWRIVLNGAEWGSK